MAISLRASRRIQHSVKEPKSVAFICSRKGAKFTPGKREFLFYLVPDDRVNGIEGSLGQSKADP